MPTPNLTLDEYQRLALRTDILPHGANADSDDRFILPLLGLTGEVGALATEWKKRRRDITGYRAFTDELREELGDVLWYVAVLADRTGLHLSDIADFNLRKTREAFLIDHPLRPHALYDEDRPPQEQLPRRLAVTFRERITDRGGEHVSAVTVHLADDSATQVGDSIDDNSEAEDDYRYHDVFHLAHMAVLGWSPVMRTLLRPKRKRRDSRNDRIEDGGRAIAIEEGLTAAVFAEARRHSYFSTSERVSRELLKSCQRMTSHLEVASRTTADWQQAILAGYRAYNFLREHRAGLVVANMATRTVTCSPLNDSRSDRYG